MSAETFPRWIVGDPGDRSTAIVPTLLREVAPNLYVGSERAMDFMPAAWASHGALVQLSSSCNPVGEMPTYYSKPLVWPRRPTLDSVVAWADACAKGGV